MRQEVFVRFREGREFELPVHAGQVPAADVARAWLDAEFVANDCEPLRASGKVLTADKVLALAATVGEARFERDPDWAARFAAAALGALARPMVRVDVDAGAVTF
jgi:hypothetical protein